MNKAKILSIEKINKIDKFLVKWILKRDKTPIINLSNERRHHYRSFFFKEDVIKNSMFHNLDEMD